MKRRSFLGLLVKIGGALIAAIIAIPALITAFSPVIRRPRDEIWVAVGDLESFPLDAVHKAVVEVPWNGAARPLQEKGVFVWRKTGEEVVVFSRSCTDLSCPVTYDPGSGWFFCPCHGGIFDEEGRNVAGPPPRPLDRFAIRVRDDVLEIDLNSIPPVS
jgi:menaquinol-cytochrome c reductase iron-sulfur subunit